MSRSLQPRRLNLVALAQADQRIAGQTPVSDLPRLAEDVPAQAPVVPAIEWQALAQLRASPAGPSSLWLHLLAHAQVPLVCQRCLASVVESLEVDRWFRFVETEAEAEAQDEEAQEDLLVMEPQFDLLALLEDELLMALPLVPMHDRCPEVPNFQAAEDQVTEVRPHPFAALAQLKKTTD